MERKRKEQDGRLRVDHQAVIAVAVMILILKCKTKWEDQSKVLKTQLTMTMISKLSNQKKLCNQRRNSQIWCLNQEGRIKVKMTWASLKQMEQTSSQNKICNQTYQEESANIRIVKIKMQWPRLNMASLISIRERLPMMWDRVRIVQFKELKRMEKKCLWCLRIGNQETK